MTEAQPRMNFILEGLPKHRFAVLPCACRVSTLRKLAFQDSVEGCLVIEALHTKLHEVSDGLCLQGGSRYERAFLFVKAI